MPYKPKPCAVCMAEFVPVGSKAKHCFVCMPIARQERNRKNEARWRKLNPKKAAAKCWRYYDRNREEITARERERHRTVRNQKRAIMLPIYKEKITKALMETDPCNAKNLKS